MQGQIEVLAALVWEAKGDSVGANRYGGGEGDQGKVGAPGGVGWGEKTQINWVLINCTTGYFGYHYSTSQVILNQLGAH